MPTILPVQGHITSLADFFAEQSATLHCATKPQPTAVSGNLAAVERISVSLESASMSSPYEAEPCDPTSSAYRESCQHGADADCSTCYVHRPVAPLKRAGKKQLRAPLRPTGLVARDGRYVTPYQVLGNGGTEPFDAAPISMNMLSTQLMPLFQKYTTAQHLNDLGHLLFPARRPLSLDFLQDLISDEGALHSIYAWLYSVHALMRPECDHAERSKVMSRFHHGKALAKVNAQLQSANAAALCTAVLMVINSIYYCLNVSSKSCPSLCDSNARPKALLYTGHGIQLW